MQAAPALSADAAAPAAPAAPAVAGGDARAAAAADMPSSPWLYRSEGFAEDLDSSTGTAQPEESPLLRWGLPVAVTIGVVGLAAAFSLI